MSYLLRRRARARRISDAVGDLPRDLRRAESPASQRAGRAFARDVGLARARGVVVVERVVRGRVAVLVGRVEVARHALHSSSVAYATAHGTPPTRTATSASAIEKPPPVMVTRVPPSTEPRAGETAVIVG